MHSYCMPDGSQRSYVLMPPLPIVQASPLQKLAQPEHSSSYTVTNLPDPSVCILCGRRWPCLYCAYAEDEEE